MKKVAIVMPYYNRQFQLTKTLLSIKSSSEFVVVLVDDASEKHPLIPDVDYEIDIVQVKKEDKKWVSSIIARNLGFRRAIDHHKADIIISQNPECYQVGDIATYAIKHTTQDNYLTFSTFSIDKDITFSESIDIHNIIKNNNKGASFDGETSWYNHPQHRPCHLEFCSSITTDNLIKLNGYDERMAFRLGYEDNHLLHRIIKLGLSPEIVVDPFVVHQWHYDSDNAMIARNANLYLELVKENTFIAKHIITPDLKRLS